MRCSSMLVVCLVAMLPVTAFANGTDEPAPAGAPPPAVVAPAPAPTSDATLGIRSSGMRNGFSFSAGQEFGTTSQSNVDISGQLYGLDWRIGARVAPEWSVYMHTHLSYGTAGIGGSGGVSGATGNFAAALMGERDLPARTFVALGGGYGVLNNPSGPLAAFRVGWYPMKHADGVARRMNLSLDTRLYFVEAGADKLTMKHIAVTFGYDRF